MTNQRIPRPHHPGLRPTLTVGRRSLLAGLAGSVAVSGLSGRSVLAQAESTPPAGHNPLPLPTPQATGPEGLTALLSCVPDTMLNREDGSGVHWYYADIAQQFAALGLHHDANGPAMDAEPWVPATYALAASSRAYQYAMVEEFIDAIGFQPLGMNQTLQAGDPPVQLTLFRGSLDLDRLAAAWDATGYARETTVSGAPYWTIGADAEFDIGHPVQRAVFATFNNLAILGEDILVCAATSIQLEEAVATYESGEGSAALDPVLGLSLYTLPDTTVSAMAVTPELLGLSYQLPAKTREVIDESIAASDAEVGSLPSIEGMIVGVQAGAVGEEFHEEQGAAPDADIGAGTAMMRLVMTSAADADQALSVVEYRWNSMNSLVSDEPYTELMEIVSTSVDGNVAEIDFRQLRAPQVWFSMVIQQDLLPIQTGDGD